MTYFFIFDLTIFNEIIYLLLTNISASDVEYNLTESLVRLNILTLSLLSSITFEISIDIFHIIKICIKASSFVLGRF